MSNRFEVIPFHEHQILTVQQPEGVFVVMKPIVEALGLMWHGQLERMKRHPVISEGIRVTRIPSTGGTQEMVSLALEQFHGWLLSLSSDRIKDEAKRDIIIRYQREAFRVVYEHFHGKMGQPALTRRSMAALISGQNQAIRIMRRLILTTHPDVRRSLWTMLDTVCQSIDIETPALDKLGADGMLTEETLAMFWAHLTTIMKRGYEVNFSRVPGVVALNMPAVKAAFRAENIDFPLTTEVYRALEMSANPRFVGQKTVNAPDGKARHCWVFEQVN